MEPQDRLIRDEKEGLQVTEIIVIVDRSGSMHSIVDDAVGGFNSFLHDQKELPGDAYLTLVRFDNNYEVVCESKPVKEMKDITRDTIKPRGETALLDAIGKTLSQALPYHRGEKVIVVIITDGHENASEEYVIEQVKELVETCKKHGWEFLFLGANIDSFSLGSSLGISKKQTGDYEATSRGITTAYQNVSDTVSQFRTGGNS